MRRRDIAEILREHMAPRSNRVQDWPQDEQDAYHNALSFTAGHEAVEEIRVQKAADAVWAALATSGQVEWGVRYLRVTPYATEEAARRNLYLAQLDVHADLVRRVVTPWDVVP